MNYKKKTILDADVKGKKVLCRCDFNVPTNDEGVITDDSRIVKTLPTIRYLLEQGAAVILCSHKGRPKNGYEEKYSLKVVQALLRELLGQDVALAALSRAEEEVLSDTSGFKISRELTVALRYYDGEWYIASEKELVTALTSGAVR